MFEPTDDTAKRHDTATRHDTTTPHDTATRHDTTTPHDTAVLEEAAARLAAIDERACSDDDLLEQLRCIGTIRGFLDSAETARLAEIDARGTTDEISGLRTHTWMAKETGCSPTTAKRRLQLGRTLRCDLPETRHALRDGQLCEDRARVMAAACNDRIAPELRQMEASLIAESKSMTFRAWEQRVRLVAALLDDDGPEPTDDITNNQLHVRGTGADASLSGTLVGDTAVITRHAIEQMADELFRRYRDDRDATNGAVDIPPRATLMALALAELCRRGLMVDANGGDCAPKVEATLVINALEPEVPHVDGRPLVGAAAGVLACDMSVWTLICNSLGVPLDMGREIRTANRQQRRAMRQRDGGCVFPGCDARPEHCDAHHVAHWWRDLGTTDVGHLVFLCRHHHGVIHRNGWGIHIGDDGWSWITTPTGQRLWCQRHGTTRAGPAPPSG